MRYNFFKDSEVLDTDGIAFPDPLSYKNKDASDFSMSESSFKPLNELDIKALWILLKNRGYKNLESEDVLLNLNQVPYVGMLEVEFPLYIPSEAVLQNVMKEVIY